MSENKNAFEKQYLRYMRIGKRSKELIFRLEEYYKKTPDSVGNKEALIYWRDFIRWAEFSGYTRDEINSAKIIASHGE